jgi:hypothetical protein
MVARYDCEVVLGQCAASILLSFTPESTMRLSPRWIGWHIARRFARLIFPVVLRSALTAAPVNLGELRTRDISIKKENRYYSQQTG